MTSAVHIRTADVTKIAEPAQCDRGGAHDRGVGPEPCGHDARPDGEVEPGARVEDALRRIAATMACHAAVKANYPLTHEKMHYILAELRRTAYSSVCPHGRPVVLRLTRREIEKKFQRI